MTPTYDIAPGVGAGPFHLGDSLWTVLELLRTSKTEYPKVEISWDDSQPHRSSTTIHLPHLVLFFPHSATQHLALIRIPDIPSRRCILTYEGDTHVISSPSQALTRGVVGRVLGPTYDSSGGRLEYPGVSFEMGRIGGGGGSARRGSSGDVGRGEGNGGKGTKVGNERERDGREGQGPRSRDEEVRCITVVPRQGQEAVLTGIKKCIVTPGKGVSLNLSSGETIDVTLGQTTAQDVLLDLGPPLRKYYKEDERMAKMWGKTAEGDTEGDCFWNYFQHGLDLLVSRQGDIKRIILHSNVPGTPLFGRYARCPWSTITPSGDLDHTSPASGFGEVASSSLDRGRGFPLIETSDADATVPTASSSRSTSVSPVPPPSTGVSPQPGSLLSVPRGSDGSAGGTSSSGGKKGKKKGANGSVNGQAPASKPSSPSPSPSSGGAENEGEQARRIDRENQRGFTSVELENGSNRGMLLDRIGEGGLDGVEGDMASRLVGFEGLVVEEDLASGGITSVLVYAVRSGSATAT